MWILPHILIISCIRSVHSKLWILWQWIKSISSIILIRIFIIIVSCNMNWIIIWYYRIRIWWMLKCFLNHWALLTQINWMSRSNFLINWISLLKCHMTDWSEYDFLHNLKNSVMLYWKVWKIKYLDICKND